MRTNKIAFLHLRYFDNNSEISPTGGITVAYELMPFMDGNHECMQVKADFAQCSDKDHYNRKIGNRVAAGRLQKFGGTAMFVFPKESWFDDLECELIDNCDPVSMLVNTSRAKVRIG